MQKLSVVIPAYNEASRIGQTLQSVSDYLKKQPYAWEVLVVIDGARDNTAQVVGSFASAVPAMRVISNAENNGKGYVVRQGMLAATGDVRLFMDADNSTAIDEVEKFLPCLEQGRDIVIGSIEVAGAEVHEHAQWYRRLLGHASKLLIRVVAGLWDIKDTQRGFKVFTAEAAQTVFSRSRITRFGFDFEILSIAKKHGCNIQEVPVVWNNAGASTVHLSSYIATFWDLIRVRWYLWTGAYR